MFVFGTCLGDSSVKFVLLTQDTCEPIRYSIVNMALGVLNSIPSKETL